MKTAFAFLGVTLVAPMLPDAVLALLFGLTCAGAVALALVAALGDA